MCLSRVPLVTPHVASRIRWNWRTAAKTRRRPRWKLEAGDASGALAQWWPGCVFVCVFQSCSRSGSRPVCFHAPVSYTRYKHPRAQTHSNAHHARGQHDTTRHNTTQHRLKKAAAKPALGNDVNGVQMVVGNEPDFNEQLLRQYYGLAVQPTPTKGARAKAHVDLTSRVAYCSGTG